ncbi:hypothetical protein LINPERHAP2_LOCUS39708 [Linum perenne]
MIVLSLTWALLALNSPGFEELSERDLTELWQLWIGEDRFLKALCDISQEFDQIID